MAWLRTAVGMLSGGMGPQAETDCKSVYLGGASRGRRSFGNAPSGGPGASAQRSGGCGGGSGMTSSGTSALGDQRGYPQAGVEAFSRGLFHVQPLDRGRGLAMGADHYPQPVRNAC
jgi:hypothetical protein